MDIGTCVANLITKKNYNVTFLQREKGYELVYGSD